MRYILFAIAVLALFTAAAICRFFELIREKPRPECFPPGGDEIDRHLDVIMRDTDTSGLTFSERLDGAYDALSEQRRD